MSPPIAWHRGKYLSLITTHFCMQSKYCREYARNDNVMYVLRLHVDLFTFTLLTIALPSHRLSAHGRDILMHYIDETFAM